MDRSQHNELMAEWAASDHHKGQSFKSDGPIDWDRWWSSAPRRVLFLLKEAYGDFGDLIDLLKKGPFGKGWWTAAYWAYGLQRMNADRLPEFPYEKDDDVINSFTSSAIVNIKKSGGKSNSDREDIKRYIELDGALIKRQVDALQPHYIVCGSTWDHVRHLWPDARQISDLAYSCASPNHKHRSLVLDYWHPAVRWPDLVMYYAIVSMAQNAAFDEVDGRISSR